MSLVTGTTAVFGDTHPNPRGYLYPEAIRPHPQPTAGEGGREGGREVVVVVVEPLSKPLPLFWTGRHRFFVFSVCFMTLRTAAGCSVR